MNQRGIGFSAVITPRTYYVDKGKTILFDHVVTNEGNNFDKNTGTFTAPVNGLYVFGATISADKAQNGVAIVKNGIRIRYIFVHSQRGKWKTATKFGEYRGLEGPKQNHKIKNAHKLQKRYHKFINAITNSKTPQEIQNQRHETLSHILNSQNVPR